MMLDIKGMENDRISLIELPIIARPLASADRRAGRAEDPTDGEMAVLFLRKYRCVEKNQHGLRRWSFDVAKVYHFIGIG